MAGTAHHVRHLLHHLGIHHHVLLSGFLGSILATRGRCVLDVMQHLVDAAAALAAE
jgi:hypothetical protein